MGLRLLSGNEQGYPPHHYIRHKNAVTGKVLQGEPFLTVELHGGTGVSTIRSQLVGDYNLPNIIVAAAVGEHFKVRSEDIVNAIEQYSPEQQVPIAEKRQQYYYS
jgi:UDP-N-acetylmuramoyl-tripeptide--D-alanyl-D-alanine ligase